MSVYIEKYGDLFGCHHSGTTKKERYGYSANGPWKAEMSNCQTSFEKESSHLKTSENAALKRRLAIFYSPRQHSLAHYCCKRSRWISCCAGQKDKLCLKEPKMWKTVRKRSLSHAAAQSTTTIGLFEEISWWIRNIHIKENAIIISFDHWVSCT